jgi:hypothetical protein
MPGASRPSSADARYVHYERVSPCSVSELALDTSRVSPGEANLTGYPLDAALWASVTLSP